MRIARNKRITPPPPAVLRGGGGLVTKASVTPIPGVEIVRGHIAAMSLDLAGVSAERGLACDRYRIALCGDSQRGTFTGTSRAFGSWKGRLRGVYQFRDEAGSGT